MAADKSILTAPNETDPAGQGKPANDLSAQLAEAVTRLAEAEQIIARLKHEILLLRNWRYGRHSEKTAADATGSLFAELGDAVLEAAALAAGDATPQEQASSTQKKEGSTVYAGGIGWRE